MSNSFYREIINEHNLRPIHKHILPRAGLSHRGINPSCGDDITLQLTIKDGVIAEGAFFTVILQVVFFPLKVLAVMVALPVLRAMTLPSLSTETTLALEVE